MDARHAYKLFHPDFPLSIIGSTGAYFYTFPRLIGNRVKPIIILIMPQLLPFYFVNQLSFAFLVLITMVYVFGTYILPAFAELFVKRMYITKL